jgi:hypothetical protein
MGGQRLLSYLRRRFDGVSRRTFADHPVRTDCRARHRGRGSDRRRLLLEFEDLWSWAAALLDCRDWGELGAGQLGPGQFPHVGSLGALLVDGGVHLSTGGGAHLARDVGNGKFGEFGPDRLRPCVCDVRVGH